MARPSRRILEAYLAAGARLGDRRAQHRLVSLWSPRLFAHAHRLLGDREQAREAVQDGWVEIMRGLHRLRDDEAFAAWAYRIVTRRCARIVRRLQADRRIAEAAAAEPANPASAIAETGADADKVRAAIASLPPAQRAAIALFYLEDMSVAEAAVALDVPAGTVKTRLMHARRKLREVLGGGENE